MSGFLDLRARCSKVRSGLDLTRDWLIPNKDDLTFYNFNTHSAHSTPTKVHMIISTYQRMCHVSCPQDFCVLDVSLSTAATQLRFQLLQQEAELAASPNTATLSGAAAASLLVELVGGTGR